MPRCEQPTIPERKIFSVSELTARIKELLEASYPFVWICGEISNLRIPASGHCYFTLKDTDARIQAVMFRGQHRNLRFSPEDGMSVTGFGRISVYAPRGAYQVILEYLEPAGAGALQAAFEQLKQKLSKEGLFDPQHKKAVPFLPSRVAVISSATGAVVHDILRVIDRRFPDMPVQIIPAAVQGEKAVSQITAALKLANDHAGADVIILARGGGSLEDLAAFNSEEVARAVFASRIPVISGVGHETDFTIADFVADMRAPTPSAAAELAVPVRQEVLHTLRAWTRRMYAGIARRIQEQRQYAEKLNRRLVHPGRRLDDLRLRIDDDHTRMKNAVDRLVRQNQERLEWRQKRLFAVPVKGRIQALADRCVHLESRLKAAAITELQRRRAAMDSLYGRMYALSPAAVLERGYSITRRAVDGSVITDAGRVQTGENVDVLLSKGSITCRIEKVNKNGEKKDL